MITSRQLQERQLDELYDWVDSFTLSRPKKNIGRDFSDGVMMAEIISLNFPKFVQLHNYPPNSSLKAKINNWQTLNNKVLSKMGICLTPEDIKRISSCTAMAIEAVLFELKTFIDQTNKEREDEEKNFPDPFEGSKPKQSQHQQNPTIANKLYTSSKIQELRQVLQLLKQKISIVEQSIQRKDSHIRQLQQTLKVYSG